MTSICDKSTAGFVGLIAESVAAMRRHLRVEQPSCSLLAVAEPMPAAPEQQQPMFSRGQQSCLGV